MLALIDKPIDANRVYLEQLSRTTAENAWFVMSTLRDVARITIVSSVAHSLRSLILFRLARREFGMSARISFHFCAGVGFESYLHELRWMHHIPLNIREARARLLDVQSQQTAE